jgi:hypothetical protein
MYFSEKYKKIVINFSPDIFRSRKLQRSSETSEQLGYFYAVPVHAEHYPTSHSFGYSYHFNLAEGPVNAAIRVQKRKFGI